MQLAVILLVLTCLLAGTVCNKHFFRMAFHHPLIDQVSFNIRLIKWLQLHCRYTTYVLRIEGHALKLFQRDIKLYLFLK